MTSYTGTIRRSCALGRTVALHDVNGSLEYVTATLTKVLEETTTPGDVLDICIKRSLPPDHELVGIDLEATAEEPEERA